MTPNAMHDTWILSGPTASGKTAVALALAERLPIEVISVDSALVYRGMDIGTAKPTPEELARVPHHLIDLLDPHESYSAARFVADARRLCAEIRARGRIPLLVGGTLLYVKALVHGIDDMPASDPAIRAWLDEQAQTKGWPALHAELEKVDPVTAARLAPNDAQRIQRALEVWHGSGRPLSSFQTRQQADAQLRPEGFRMLSLEPHDRAWLHRRIAERLDTMMAQGFVDEVQRLRRDPRLHAGLSAIRCVGYRQVWEALDAGLDLAAPQPRAEVLAQAVAATRQLAKRQITWLRSMPWREVVPADDPDAAEKATQRLCQALTSLA